MYCFLAGDFFITRVETGPVKQKLFGMTVGCQDVNKLSLPGTTIEPYHNSLLHSQQDWHMVEMRMLENDRTLPAIQSI